MFVNLNISDNDMNDIHTNQQKVLEILTTIRINLEEELSCIPSENTEEIDTLTSEIAMTKMLIHSLTRDRGLIDSTRTQTAKENSDINKNQHISILFLLMSHFYGGTEPSWDEIISKLIKESF